MFSKDLLQMIIFPLSGRTGTNDHHNPRSSHQDRPLQNEKAEECKGLCKGHLGPVFASKHCACAIWCDRGPDPSPSLPTGILTFGSQHRRTATTTNQPPQPKSFKIDDLNSCASNSYRVRYGGVTCCHSHVALLAGLDTEWFEPGVHRRNQTTTDSNSSNPRGWVWILGYHWRPLVYG